MVIVLSLSSLVCTGADGASFFLLAAHVFARVMPSQSHEQISEPDLRQMTPGGGTGRHHDHALQVARMSEATSGNDGSASSPIPGFRFAHPGYKIKKGKRNAERR
jgi:hypothetical protein